MQNTNIRIWICSKIIIVENDMVDEWNLIRDIEMLLQRPQQILAEVTRLESMD